MTSAGVAKVSSGLLDPGTVLLSSRAPVGYLAITTIPLAINQGFIALKPTEALPASYLLNWCHANMDEIKGRASGSTFAEISKKAFRPIPMLTPPPEVTSEFDETVRPLYERITANLAESETLSTLRDTLLPRLLSGELRPPADRGGLAAKEAAVRGSNDRGEA